MVSVCVQHVNHTTDSAESADVSVFVSVVRSGGG